MVNRALPILHGGSLNLTPTVPLRRKNFFGMEIKPKNPKIHEFIRYEFLR